MHSKLLWQTRLFQNPVRRVSRADGRIHHERSLRDRTEPNFVIALAIPSKAASCRVQKPFQIRRVIRHSSHELQVTTRFQVNERIAG